MVQTFSNILSESEIHTLLDYHYNNDNRTDTRKTVRSKHPRWNIDKWPQSILEKALSTVLGKDYNVEEVIFNESRISFQLHADSGYKDNKFTPHKAIILPLYCENNQGSTVFFNNFWYGEAAKFTRADDLFKTFKDQENQLSTKDQRITDYSKIVNYNNIPFNKDLYKHYCSHIPYENLHGLTLSDVVEWNPGDVIVFDRSQIHCATSAHSLKIGITIFTQI